MSSTESVRGAYASRSQDYIDLVERTWPDDADDVALVRDRLTALTGPVLDVGCGPGQWTGYLHALGVDVIGLDVVPEFVAHAHASHPECDVRLGSMTELDVADHTVAGILAWYSTIHLPPAELDQVLTEFRRVLAPDGVLVLGFFDSDDEVAAFDHAVVTAYRWPVEVLAEHLRNAGFVVLDRRRHRRADRPDRKYAALAAKVG